MTHIKTVHKGLYSAVNSLYRLVVLECIWQYTLSSILSPVFSIQAIQIGCTGVYMAVCRDL